VCPPPVRLGQIGGVVALARPESVLVDASIEVRHRAPAIVFAMPDHDQPDNGFQMAFKWHIDGALLDNRWRLYGAQEENAPRYRLEVITALRHVQTPTARAKRESFVRMTGSTLDDHQVLLAAMSACAHGHPEPAPDLLRAMLEDENPYVRERAAALLG
jgi:HEAT repeat protein